MTIDKLNVKKLKNIIYSLLIFPLNTFAQRVSNEDIHGDTLSGGSGLFALIIGLIVFLFVIKTMMENKGFRAGIFIYIGILLSIILVGKIFGEEITIIYLLGLAVLFLIYDKKITDEKVDQSKDELTKQKYNSDIEKNISKKPTKICSTKFPKNKQKSIQCRKCGSFQMIDDSSKMVDCNLCKHKWLYEKES